MLKRSVDVVLGSILLLAILPILLVAVILVKLDSPGPAFFCQTRVGRRFSRFTIYKLRTMHVNAEGPSYTLGNDPRLTRIGLWVRRSKLDELPQLWNVLRGEMSLVGPRPVVTEVVADFEQQYRVLLKIRPGLTDPATLKYCRENDLLSLVPNPQRYFREVTTPDKLSISMEYAAQANLWRDFRVIQKTILTVVERIIETVPRRQTERAGSVQNLQAAIERKAS